MRVRGIITADRDAAADWLKKRNWPTEHLYLDIMPRSGFAAVDGDGELRAVVWLYVERDRLVAVPAWFVANPTNTPGQSRRAIRALLEAIRLYAVANGIKLLAAPARRGLKRTMERTGWTVGEDTTLMIMKMR